MKIIKITLMFFCFAFFLAYSTQASDLFFLQNFRIPQNGMYPTLPANSVIWVKKGPLFDLSKVSKGDIVVYEDISKKGKYVFVWRVMGLPGDQILINGKSIIINGSKISRIQEEENAKQIIYKETINAKQYLVAYDKNPKSKSRIKVNLTVPSRHFFLMGDNRDNAYDSRFKGPVKGEMIFGIKM